MWLGIKHGRWPRKWTTNGALIWPASPSPPFLFISRTFTIWYWLLPDWPNNSLQISQDPFCYMPWGSWAEIGCKEYPRARHWRSPAGGACPTVLSARTVMICRIECLHFANVTGSQSPDGELFAEGNLFILITLVYWSLFRLALGRGSMAARSSFLSPGWKQVSAESSSSKNETLFLFIWTL